MLVDSTKRVQLPGYAPTADIDQAVHFRRLATAKGTPRVDIVRILINSLIENDAIDKNE